MKLIDADIARRMLELLICSYAQKRGNFTYCEEIAVYGGYEVTKK